MSSSSERSQILELFELQADEGPCLDCFASGRQVSNALLRTSMHVWPRFAPVAFGVGLHVVHALPMRLRRLSHCLSPAGDKQWGNRQVIGVVNVFHADERVLSEKDLELAQALADVATIAIIQERSIRSATQTAEQLQCALDSRIVIEQAKGVVAEHLNLDMDKAFALLRTYARDNNQRLGDVAERATRLPLGKNDDLTEELESMCRRKTEGFGPLEPG